MDQFKFASLSHTDYWYEVGMLIVPMDMGDAVVSLFDFIPPFHCSPSRAYPQAPVGPFWTLACSVYRPIYNSVHEVFHRTGFQLQHPRSCLFFEPISNYPSGSSPKLPPKSRFHGVHKMWYIFVIAGLLSLDNVIFRTGKKRFLRENLTIFPNISNT